MTVVLTPKEIKEIIKNDKKMSQAGLAEYCSVSKSLVSKWLNDKRSIPPDKTNLIYEYLQVDKNKSTLSTNDKKDINVYKYDLIRDDLLIQLEQQSKTGKHYADLVDHAVYLFGLKDKLQNDIDTNGLRITLSGGNGHSKEVDNASIRNLNQVSAQLMRVLKGLGLDEPEIDDGFDPNDFV